MRKFLTIASSLALLLSLAGPAGASQRYRAGQDAHVHGSDNHPGPLTERQDARRKAAMDLILSGKASPNKDGVVTLGEDKYFQAQVTGTGQVFTILSEFGNQGSGKLGTDPGPVHNEIAKPNRQVVDGQANADYNPAVPYDNFKHWTADFNRAYYLDLFFGGTESFADFYSHLSGGLYTVDGDVSSWVQVPGNASTYGDNSVEDFGGAWQFIEDSGNAWYDAQIAAGKTKADIEAYLAQFDVWDRYDHDNDGNFDEADGYIDHFQAVHAGEGEDAGGGPQGEDAIWSHRWYVNQTDFGQTGPADAMFGGAQIGDTGYWIGDYTVEAENGGLGVFAHEFGHDLGLPDFYDTNAGENGTAFWTLMSSGSWLNEGTEDIGSKPDYYGPWERLQLGWLNIADVLSAGESGSYSLAPSEAVIVDVPDEGIETTYTSPYSGSQMWWSTSDDDLNTTLGQSFDLSAYKSATLTAKAWYNIEAGYDYLHVEYSTDGGAHWTEASGSPLTGSSKGHWKTLRYSIPGGAVTEVRFRFQSDGGVHLANVFLDDIALKSGGTQIFSDPVDDADGWTAEGGFRLSTGVETTIGDRYYIAENRTYVGYDATLETGPYQFSFGLTDPDKVEHFPFQDGLLVWLVDETYSDNNNSEHPGHGLALPVDARPMKFGYGDGTSPSNRRQPFDATFGLQAVPAGPTFDAENPGTPLPCAGLHKQIVVGKGQAQAIGYLCAWPTADERQAIPVFDDTDPNAYWLASNPQNSTIVAGVGVTMEVTDQVTGGALDVTVDNPAGS